MDDTPHDGVREQPLLRDRGQRIVSDPRVRVSNVLPPVAPDGLPPDLVALYALAGGGLELDDGTRVLGATEIAGATKWLRDERALEWGDDLLVIGERDDLVLVRDLDAGQVRSGGGLLETPTDGLTQFRRRATTVLGYLEERLGLPEPEPAPERAALLAIDAGDPAALAVALERAWYPGSDRAWAHAAMRCGALEAGDEARALAWFERSAAARVRAVPRGAAERETAAAWRACAAEALQRGAKALAEACLARVDGRAA